MESKIRPRVEAPGPVHKGAADICRSLRLEANASAGTHKGSMGSRPVLGASGIGEETSEGVNEDQILATTHEGTAEGGRVSPLCSEVQCAGSRGCPTGRRGHI